MRAKLKTGIVPDSKRLYRELDAVGRRAFLPRAYVDIYKATPTMSALLGEPWPWWRRAWHWCLSWMRW